MGALNFKIEKKLAKTLARAGQIETSHGVINTPAFVTVGTKATVKSLSPEQIKETGAQVVLANTYHLYLEPGEKILKKAGGLGKFMNWQGPTMTDSGGFQVFSLGQAKGRRTSKVSGDKPISESRSDGADLENSGRLVKITEDGVMFRSHIDGSEHFFSPERSMEIQQAIGADMIFAFDECTSPYAGLEYQKEAMNRTHRWALRSLSAHRDFRQSQAIFGIVQGGRFEELRKTSAKTIGAMDFDGFGVGGSFDKEDMGKAVKWVNEILPEEKPRHLLGIGEPGDLFMAVENGCDLFDCVSPTRIARNGSLYTAQGPINILNAKFRTDFTPIEENCLCYTCKNFTRAYIAHLFRADELLAYSLGSIHNLYFIIHLVKEMRQTILEDTLEEFKTNFLKSYRSK